MPTILKEVFGNVLYVIPARVPRTGVAIQYVMRRADKAGSRRYRFALRKR